MTNNQEMIEALIASMRLCNEVLPEFDWGSSFLSASAIQQINETPRQVRMALGNAIKEAGFEISGPTDHRAAENGEPVWVCNARAAMAG